MQYLSRSTTLLALTVALVSCASRPTPTAAAASAAVPAKPALAAMPAAPASPASPAAVTPVAAPTPLSDDAAAAKAARQLGFQPRQRGGVTMYCRNEAVVGSRFKEEMCISRDNLADVLQRSVNDQRKVETIQRQCMGSGCAGGITPP